MPIILRSVSVVWTVRLIILLVSFWKVMFDVWIEFLTMKAVCPALLSELGAGMYLNFPSLHAISTILFFMGQVSMPVSEMNAMSILVRVSSFII